MAIKNYRGYAYFDNRPEIVKIFEDLEALLDFCRFELLPFNEADLYNRNSNTWRLYQDKTRKYSARKQPWNGERKPYQGKNPRY
jgi:hypothetical protein